MSDEPTVKTETTKKPKKAKLESVINCSRAGGTITGLDGSRIPVGELVELPLAVCERLVRAGVARYPTKGETA